MVQKSPFLQETIKMRIIQNNQVQFLQIDEKVDNLEEACSLPVPTNNHQKRDRNLEDDSQDDGETISKRQRLNGDENLQTEYVQICRSKLAGVGETQTDTIDSICGNELDLTIKDAAETILGMLDGSISDISLLLLKFQEKSKDTVL